jgi:uroporphyrin-3 C-methyltransferase
LSARIALLSRDENVFKQDIEASLHWVQRYFDIKSKHGSAMLEGLNLLSRSKIYVVLPDLGASLQAIRNYRLTREKAGQ